MEGRGIFDLSGKVVLVTGGGWGIGRTYCEAMAEFGADVACNDIVEEMAEETIGLISKFGNEAIAIKADASKENEIEYMVKRTVKHFGKIDVVFANAGILDRSVVKIHEKTVEDWDRVYAVQPRGVFLLMRAAFPIMMKNKRGSFIATASTGGLRVSSRGGFFELLSAYNSAKAAVIMLTKIAARQYGGYGIRVNAICPGYQHKSEPPTSQAGLSEQERSMIEEKLIIPFTPLQRVGLPEELKGLAVWLASDASSFVTAQAFVQDGGMGG